MTRATRVASASAIVLGVLGMTSVAGAIALSVAATPEQSAVPPVSSSSPSFTAPTPTPGQTSTAESAVDGVVVAQLASAGWVERTARASGIPQRALAAYAGAALAAGQSHPDCRIGWNTLAAIGFVESEHATLGGAVLRPDGDVRPVIIGVPLNGDGVDAVADSDDGALDGDTLWDRAVGPLQFIPSTWSLAGRDGNADGRADINNIDDAAYSAALHLCETGGDLSSPEGWIAAVAAYNSSVEYNNRVAAEATRLAELT